VRRALAVVGVHAVHAVASVLTAVAQAVVHVVLAVETGESWNNTTTKKNSQKGQSRTTLEQWFSTGLASGPTIIPY